MSLIGFVTRLVKTDHLISVALFLQFLFPKLRSLTLFSPTNMLITTAHTFGLKQCLNNKGEKEQNVN